MRHRLALLMLFAFLPVLDALAAPAPEPYAILEIEPPPTEGSLEFTGKTPEEYRKGRVDVLINPHSFPLAVWRDPEVRKLPSVAALKDPRYWLSKNLRITWEGEGNRLRVMFRAGNRTEQVAIINSLLRAYLGKERQRFFEEQLRWKEDRIPELEQRIKCSPNREYTAEYQKAIDDLRSRGIPALRAEVARYKQIAVIKWAR